MRTKPTQLWLITLAIAACCVVVCTSGVANADTVFTDAAAYYKLDGNVSDSSSEENDGTNYGATSVSGKVGGAYAFNGNNQYITLDSPVNITDTDYTVSFWVIKTGNNIVGMGRTGVGSYPSGYAGYFYNSYEYHMPNTAGGGDYCNITHSLGTTWTEWHHFVVRRNGDGNDVDFFVDGEAVGPVYYGSGYGGLANNPFTPDLIGNRGDGQYDFNGKFDEIAFWDRALSTNEVGVLYNTGLIGGGVINTLGFEQETYDTDALDQLADLYAAQTGSVTIDGIVWTYISEVPEGHGLGDAWTDSGTHYIQLQSNSDGLTGTGVPEPATVVGLVLTVIIGGLGRLRHSRMS